MFENYYISYIRQESFIGGTRNYFTNCYVALVGETSHTKKSTAVDECHDRLSSLDKGLIHIDNINSSQGLEKMFALPDEVNLERF